MSINWIVTGRGMKSACYEPGAESVNINSLTHSLIHSMKQSPPLEERSPKLVKKFPPFYETQRFIKAFTKALTNPVHASHLTSRKSILILSPIIY
jgi:hypothetical protein